MRLCIAATPHRKRIAFKRVTQKFLAQVYHFVMPKKKVEEEHICSRISQEALALLPKKSILRQGIVHKLELGEVSVVDTTVPMIYLDGGTAKVSEERYDNSGLPRRVMLTETPVFVRTKVHYSKMYQTTDAHVKDLAAKLIDTIVRKENDLIVQLLSEVTFVPRRDYYRVRKFFKNLGRQALVMPEDKIDSLIPHFLATWIRSDLSTTWQDNPNNICVDFLLSESLSPTLVDKTWFPGTTPWTT